MDSTVRLLIEKICKKNKIEYQALSNDWVLMLKKNDKVKFITGYKFDNNSHALGKILDDKYATYDVLKKLSIPICHHDLLYSKYDTHSYAKYLQGAKYLKRLFMDNNRDIVIKPNSGTCGQNVMRFNNYKKLMKFYNKLHTKNSYSVCPFYKIINEYRAIVLDKEIMLVYKKELPIVFGDGEKSIKELLCSFNYPFFKNVQDKKLNKVLKSNEKYVYTWKFNLSNGSRANKNITCDELKEIKKIVNSIIEKIDTSFCSIDIIKTSDNKFMVLEINSGVMLKNFILSSKDNYEIGKKVYEKAIKKLVGE